MVEIVDTRLEWYLHSYWILSARNEKGHLYLQLEIPQVEITWHNEFDIPKSCKIRYDHKVIVSGARKAIVAHWKKLVESLNLKQHDFFEKQKAELDALE
jgi:hypothetical protein